MMRLLADAHYGCDSLPIECSEWEDGLEPAPSVSTVYSA
jgi:hypothetical protein